MKIPGNMMSPRLKLEDGEEVLESAPALRKKGVFGNRFGTLYLTNQRLAFVKAIMKAGLISGAIGLKGAKPMLQFPRAEIDGAEKIALKKQIALCVSHGGKQERFVCEEAALDQLLTQL